MPFTKDQLSSLPKGSGVYIMRNRDGKVLYIGKANNVRARLKQYFSLTDTRTMIPFLLEQIETIDTLLVETEKEALLLENNLIKQHQPKYNACLKDDKSYFSLMVNHKHRWPMLRIVRYKGMPAQEGLYFGPYTKGQAAKETLELLRRFFPLRQCSDRELVSRSRPCILYDMKRCVAPCVEKCTPEEYKILVERVINFLRGHDAIILKELKEEMEQAAKKLEFEKADAILKTIQNIEATLERQKVEKITRKDLDIIGLARQGTRVAITVLFFREGRLAGSSDHLFEEILQEDEPLISSFILQNYSDKEFYPKEILSFCPLQDQSTLAQLISEQAGFKVDILSPKIGEKKALMALAIRNAAARLEREKKGADTRSALISAEEQLNLINYPERIECIDTSHIGGHEMVAALVVFVGGVKSTAHYRHYKLKVAASSDDYAALKEVLIRRFSHALEEKVLPDLLLIDGGRSHLNVAVKLLESLNISTVDLLAISKESSKHTKGLTLEKIHHPELPEPLSLNTHSSVLHLLQRIRDEAHRFAISFHKKRRSKSQLDSALDHIKGIGPLKKQRLLSTFGSVKKIFQATEEELLAVKGIHQKDVKLLKEWYNARENGI